MWAILPADCERLVAGASGAAGTKEVAAPPENDARWGCEEAFGVEVVRVVDAIQSPIEVQPGN